MYLNVLLKQKKRFFLYIKSSLYSFLMTTASGKKSSDQFNKEQFGKILRVLNQIIDCIGEFEDHYDKKFNFSKLADLLEVPNSVPTIKNKKKKNKYLDTKIKKIAI